ncbi:D-alanyl-D-alanine carboxypeptidase family protein [Pelagibaculum spongiae]|uniref:serine-type D-Ala-D-Ala carboxypeptidase n=1 Tax=Pelagibaculum spongiae TaxID=2080658 RepID=A0A2V1H5R9_9GAMM|nr:D-alanyl-D-alanine carboxypeptidase family protein [Pelagibaculum spongiae]PVZ72608.1 serine-type D-Ala-D-Ala carboxypeptidase [Pelagibaculum spongiae]
MSLSRSILRTISTIKRTCAVALLVVSVPATAAFIPAAPELAAKSYVLMDFDSGRVLVNQNGDDQVEPASLTKMMTVYVVDQELAGGRLNKDELVRISKKAWKTEGSRMFVDVNTKVRVGDLLKGVIIQSGNDASVALAEHIAGTEEAFAELMNTYAVKLNMTGSHFMNATGLPAEGHYTTAMDMATLAQAIIRDFPENYSLYSEKWFKWNDIRQPNRNKLLWRDSSVDGLKTGHTEAAGFCLVTSAKKKNMRLISAVMGTKSDNARAQESQKLLTYGFRFFETHKLYQAAQPLHQSRIWKGSQEQLELGLAQDFYITVPRGQKPNLKAEMVIDQPFLEAPAAKGEQFGKVEVKLEGAVIAERPLVALQAVEEGGLFSRLWDSLILLIKRLLI